MVSNWEKLNIWGEISLLETKSIKFQKKLQLEIKNRKNVKNLIHNHRGLYLKVSLILNSKELNKD